MLLHIISIILLVLGFGFVIFFHELGHFLAAKWVGIRVEQFAVGFGQALIAWRKGIGFRVGTTQKEFEERIQKHIHAKHKGQSQANEVPISYANAAVTPTPTERDQAAAELGLGETEYRLNWIPLGGYVKMLGQDDLKPNSEADDPRAYNRKSIGARMVVVSAGVIMNVILAGIGFMIVFLIGFKVPAAQVGAMYPQSPAQQAGMEPGDTIKYINGHFQSDFTKIALNTALLQEGVPATIVVNRDGKDITLGLTPARSKGESEFLGLGIEPMRNLRGLPKNAAEVEDPGKLNLMLPAEALGPKPGTLVVNPGDVITAVNGTPVNTITVVDGKEVMKDDDYPVLARAMQNSFGKPVELTVKGPDGSIHTGQVYPHFMEPYTGGPVEIMGLVPRARVMTITPESPALQKVLPGDVVQSITLRGDKTENPSPEGLKTVLKRANGHNVDMEVIRDGDKSVMLKDLSPTMRIKWGVMGLGVGLDYDEQHAVVGQVLDNTPATKAGIEAGATINSINGQDVQSWYDVHRLLRDVQAGTVQVAYTPRDGQTKKTVALTLDEAQASAVRSIRYANGQLGALLDEHSIKLETSNPARAAWWGVTETRDFILQFYLTLRRMISGSISPSNMMGPLGIFRFGAAVAFKGMDWLIWFLAMISANLAVVNFLPIPIVDGGLFTFLLLEKLQGKPLSPRVHAIAQYVGLAFLAGVFLFVTYHDILRQF